MPKHWIDPTRFPDWMRRAHSERFRYLDNRIRRWARMERLFGRTQTIPPNYRKRYLRRLNRLKEGRNPFWHEDADCEFQPWSRHA